uniref:Uncharacterized protein n=1 Tax=Rhizophora mucronata TaxID=61149 RepID=A0A2P2QXP1_RHIMU
MDSYQYISCYLLEHFGGFRNTKVMFI